MNSALLPHVDELCSSSSCRRAGALVGGPGECDARGEAGDPGAGGVHPELQQEEP